MNKRKIIEEKIFRVLTGLATYSLIAILGYIIAIIFINGFSSLSLDMITKTPSGGYYYGGEGGVLNAIVGSLYIALGATIIAIIVGVPASLFINVHLIRYNAHRIPFVTYSMHCGAFHRLYMERLGLH